MERWKRFKRAERVMLSGLSRKKDIYDKRPEDHPDYGVEWTIFWEEKYKELMTQGIDTDNYDFKKDWIPHWSKRMTEMFDDEVKNKTADLLKQYDLVSAEEPKPEDYVEDLTQDDPFQKYLDDFDNFKADMGNGFF